MVKRVFPLVTVADIEQMPDDEFTRYEVIDGELHVSRAPSLDHQFIVASLSFLFKLALRADPVGRAFPGPGVVFDKFNGVIPDFVYISNERYESATDGKRFTSAPDIVVEILSPGRENEDRDRFDKRYIYSKFEVQEYWIIDPERRRIEVLRLVGSTLEHAAEFAGDDEVTTPVLPTLRFAARELFFS